VIPTWGAILEATARDRSGYSQTGRGGVGLMVHVNLVKKVIDVKHLNSRIIVMELAV